MRVLILFVLSFGFAQAERTRSDWIAEKFIDGQPYSTLTLTLVESDNSRLTGNYCFITKFGKRIDCDPDESINHIKGVKTKKHAKIEFYSSFAMAYGKARLIFNKDTALWETTEVPKGERFYGPYKAILKKQDVEVSWENEE